MRTGHRRPLLEAHRGGEKVAKPSGAQTNFPFSTRQTASLTPRSHCPFTPHGANNICVLSELPPLAPRERWTAHSWPCVSWASHSREEITEVFGQEEWQPACENLSSLCQKMTLSLLPKEKGYVCYALQKNVWVWRKKLNRLCLWEWESGCVLLFTLHLYIIYIFKNK